MTRIVGYTRTLVTDTDPAGDSDALRSAGAEVIFADAGTGDPRRRPELVRCLASLSAGDVLVVTSAPRLSHAIGHFLSTCAGLTARGVAVQCVAQPALSTGVKVPAGDVLAALDGLRRELVGLRTRAGMTVAASAGRRAGRPLVMTADRVSVARELRDQDLSLAQIARVLGVSTSTVQRALTRPATSR
ncbi:recombinase family protein [Microbacter sp. GSS18]|nr:recombinase family protein [Microbacter sp. GSS18]